MSASRLEQKKLVLNEFRIQYQKCVFIIVAKFWFDDVTATLRPF